MRSVSGVVSCLGGVLLVSMVPAIGSVLTAQQTPAAPKCQPMSKLIRVAELPEGSGLAASRRTPGRFWSHNDSGDPVLFALDSDGKVTGRVRVTGAAVDDWEAVAVGACPGGSCIYVGDIGDNDAKRSHVTVYRVREPAEASGSAEVSGIFRASYPDGAHDAESLLVAADGRLHIVTKGDTGAVSLYRFPADLDTRAMMPLERVGKPRDEGQPAENDRITDGSVSGDGRWVVLRTKQSLTFYRSNDFFAGTWRKAGHYAVSALAEPQGEGVAFGSDTGIYLMSEGGGRKQPGAFAKLSCTLGP